MVFTHGMIVTTRNFHAEGQDDGRWLFINANNTPRIARLDLGVFKTREIIELPNRW
jgi:nitrous-oxide reductase